MCEFTKGGVQARDEFVLEREKGAPGVARRFVAERFAKWGVSDDYDGRVIVSEFVTNALVHGDGCIVLRVFRDEVDGLPVIEVQDDGNRLPVVRPENFAATCGRGLVMVAGLAREWGTRPLTDGGKVVWAKCGI